MRHVVDDDGQFRMTRIPLSHGASGYTMDGKPAVKTMRTDDGVDNIGALLYFHYPNTWNHWMGIMRSASRCCLWVRTKPSW